LHGIYLHYIETIKVFGLEIWIYIGKGAAKITNISEDLGRAVDPRSSSSFADGKPIARQERRRSTPRKPRRYTIHI
jgi:hypothetical protein